MAKETTWTDVMASERVRLTNERATAMERRKEIDGEIADIDRELKAITAYETVKAGKPVPTARTSIMSARSGGVSRTDGILALLKDNTDGLTRGEILEKLNLKGDTSGSQSVSNALNNMKKAGKIGNNDGKYTIA